MLLFIYLILIKRMKMDIVYIFVSELIWLKKCSNRNYPDLGFFDNQKKERKMNIVF